MKTTNRMRSLHAAALSLAAFAALLSSCASMKPITEIPGVMDVDWTLHDGNNSSTDAVNPLELRAGRSYYVSIRYLQQDKKGRTSWKRLINYEGVYLSAEGALWAVSGTSLLAPPDPFAAFDASGASLTVHLPLVNPSRKTKAVALGLPLFLPSFRGADGENGSDGDTAPTGNPDGKDGDDGEPGASLELEIARYDLSGTRFEAMGTAVLVHEIQTDRIWIVGSRGGAIELDASGGSGGAGGRGATRKIPEESAETFLKGGNGGDGGDGGNGGLVHMVIPEGSSADMAFAVNVSRGRGGAGGAGGDGDRKKNDNVLVEILSALMVNGSDGESGRDGAQGRFWREAKPLESLFLAVRSPLFERTRLRP